MEQRHLLKENAEALGNLLTENVPYLLSHYLKNGVLTEAERESIISAESAPAIRIKLFETLADKDEITLEAVMDGLSATDNHSVIAEINGLLSGKGSDVPIANDDGSGDKLADVSEYATNLVDEVIAKAEETTSQMLLAKEAENEDKPVASVASVESVNEEEEEEEEDEEEEVKKEEVVQVEVKASVQVHNSETEEAEVEKEPEKEEEPPKTEPEPEIQDRAVSFSTNVAVIDDGKDEDDHDHHEIEETPPTSPLTPPLTPSGSDHERLSGTFDSQQVDNDDDIDDNIDIEKEFVMPPEATEADVTTTKVTNGGPGLTRMESNDIILIDGKPGEKNGNAEQDELDAILARKALVRQQVEKFEKTSPTPPGGRGPSPGKVKYSFRTASQDQPDIKSEERGSNVKNLKNFFQQLSTTTDSKTQASGPVKPVGKLKVTFPAS